MNFVMPTDWTPGLFIIAGVFIYRPSEYTARIRYGTVCCGRRVLRSSSQVAV